jgi:CBS domain-containing protein
VFRPAGAILARVDIPSFLRLYPPFDELDEERLAEVVRHTHIEFFPAGTVIQHQAGEPSAFLYIVRTGAVEAVDEQLVADVLGEGELFGFVSLFTGLEPAFTLRAVEDTICYLVDKGIALEIMATRRGLAFLAGSLRRREVSVLEGPEREAIDAWATHVSELVRRPPLVVSDGSTIRHAAELMARERVSSVLVRVDGDGDVGILTDRDLRAKVVAAGRSSDSPTADIMTMPAFSVPPETTAAEVLRLMYEKGIHHVPVVGDDGEPVGMVTDTDLMALEQRTPFILKSDLEHASTVDESIQVGARLPEMFVSLVQAQVDPLDIGHAVAVTIDTLTTRLLELGMDEMGEPPCPWAWLALGSEARKEQGLATDQDNALAVECDRSVFDEVDPYFQRLATFVNDGIARAGIPRCRAGVVASDRGWRGTLDAWEERFWGWIREPARTGRAFVGIAFDYRRVAGPLDVEPVLDEVIRRSAKEDQFVRQLAKLAVEARPPVGMLKNAVVGPKGKSARALDVKQGGIAPITNLARVLAVESGVTENRTLRRLRAAAEMGRLERETLEGLEEAFDLLWQIRVERQTRAVQEGEEPDDSVKPELLGPLTRQALREAFQIIDGAQERLAAGLGIRR